MKLSAVHRTEHLGLASALLVAAMLAGCTLTGVPSLARGQALGTGVAPYRAELPARYRLLFGAGGNAGLGTDAPMTYLGSVEYQSGGGVWCVSAVSSSNSSHSPKNTLTTIGLLYGPAWDQPLARYEARPQSFHTSISGGIGIESFDQRRHQDRLSRLDGPVSPIFQAGLCLPIQMEAMYEITSYGGIGVVGFLDISRFVPSYGAAVSVEVRY